MGSREKYKAAEKLNIKFLRFWMFYHFRFVVDRINADLLLSIQGDVCRTIQELGAVIAELRKISTLDYYICLKLMRDRRQEWANAEQSNVVLNPNKDS